MVGATVVLLKVFFCSGYLLVVEPAFLFRHNDEKFIKFFVLILFCRCSFRGDISDAAPFRCLLFRQGRIVFCCHYISAKRYPVLSKDCVALFCLSVYLFFVCTLSNINVNQ